MFTQVLWILYSIVHSVERITNIIKGNRSTCWYCGGNGQLHPDSLNSIHVHPPQQVSHWTFTESTRNPGTTYGTAGNKGTKWGNVQPHRITQTTMPGEGEKFHKVTTRNAIKPALFHSKLSESIYTKDTNRNISDKRFQAPFLRRPHTKLYVIPTRNRFIYRKIRFNAKLGNTNKKQTSGGRK